MSAPWLAALLLFGCVSGAQEAASRESLRSRPGDRSQTESAAYGDWGALVVAGDNRASSGGHADAFDNARRDVSAALRGLGIASDRIMQFSVDHAAFPQEDVEPSTLSDLEDGIAWLGGLNPEGCLLYFTSHGSPEGVVVGHELLAPARLDQWLRRHCGSRPTILVVSACFSGIFTERGMLAPNRLIMTAARPDRSSFGCGEDDVYPFFDKCFLEEFPRAAGWIVLAEQIRVCVEREERRTNMSPPSEPQLSIGEAVRPLVERFPPNEPR